jgi:hypothetical protein
MTEVDADDEFGPGVSAYAIDKYWRTLEVVCHPKVHSKLPKLISRGKAKGEGKGKAKGKGETKGKGKAKGKGK